MPPRQNTYTLNDLRSTLRAGRLGDAEVMLRKALERNAQLGAQHMVDEVQARLDNLSG